MCGFHPLRGKRRGAVAVKRNGRWERLDTKLQVSKGNLSRRPEHRQGRKEEIMQSEELEFGWVS